MRAEYVGRFAPSPTGPLHFGSLLAAVGSFLDARARGGQWLVRVEDLDTPRSMPGATDAILDELDRLGLHWDGEVTRQSERGDAYRAALSRLRAEAWTFPCGCSRRSIPSSVYPGTCRSGIPSGRSPRSVRMRVTKDPVGLTDVVQGKFSQRLDREVGDFVVHRADGIIAYHLAVSIDDAAQGITHVVRGADLLDSTPRQIHILRALSLPVPSYAHLPVAVHRSGRKLSKQTGAPSTERLRAAPLLAKVLDMLGQSPPIELREAKLDELWSWARSSWRLHRVPARLTIGSPPSATDEHSSRSSPNPAPRPA